MLLAIAIFALFAGHLHAAPINIEESLITEANGALKELGTKMEKAITETHEGMVKLEEAMKPLAEKNDSAIDTAIIAMKELGNKIMEAGKEVEVSKSKLEGAMKPLAGGKPIATHLQSAISESIKGAQHALEEISVKQAKKMEELVVVNSAKTGEEQEKALMELAEKEGPKMKEAVNGMLEAKEKAQEAIATYVKGHVKTMTEEGKKASDQVLELINDKKSTNDEKVAKMEDLLGKLPEKLKEEINVKEIGDLKEFVSSAANLQNVVRMSIVGAVEGADDA